MDDKTCLPLGGGCFKNRFLFLFISLLLTIIVNPVIASITPLRILFTIFITVIILTATYALSQKARDLILASVLAVPTIGFNWASDFVESIDLYLAGDICGVLFFIFVVLRVLRFIWKQERVSGDLIIGAAVVYLLMAVTWSYIYLIIETIQPGSFAAPEGMGQWSRYPFLYYSLVTLTTLGYGDITPSTSVAGSFSVLEAVIGQLYLATMIAWLVGVHVSQSKGRGPVAKSDGDPF